MKRKYLVLFLFLFFFTFVPIAKAKQYTFSNKEDYSKNYDFYCQYDTKKNLEDGKNHIFTLYAKDDQYSLTLDGKNIGKSTLWDGIGKNLTVSIGKLELTNSCPTLQLASEGTSYSLRTYSNQDSNIASQIILEAPQAELSDAYKNSGQSAETKGAVCEKTYSIPDGSHKGTKITVQFYKTSTGKKCYSLKDSTNGNDVESCDGNSIPINNFAGKGDLQISFYGEKHYNSIYQNATFDSFPCPDIIFSVENGTVTQVYIKGNEDKELLDSFKDVRDFLLGTYEYKEGCSVLGNETMEVLQTILNYLRIGAVALLLVLGSLDFAGAVMSDKDDAMKSAGKKFKNRLIACVVVFLIPALVNIALFVVNKSDSVCDFFGGEITTVDFE